MNSDVIVIGGGIAGMEAAGQLAKAGYKVTLVEKDDEAGGNIKNWYHLFPDRRNAGDVIEYLNEKVNNSNITFIKGTLIDNVGRDKRKFTIKTDNGASIAADAIVVATGFDLFKSERKEEYGYGIYDNVITSADLEAKFRSGVLTMSNGDTPRRIGFLHCVGSRDEKAGNYYCSKLCCITAVKQAIEVKEYLPDSKVFCFYMDMRMGGAHYEELYLESQEKYGVTFIRGKVSEVGVSFNNSLIIKAEDTLVGRPLKMELDMLVLMAGMEISAGSKLLGKSLGLNTGENRFFISLDNHFASNVSNIKGVFYAGTCTAPMNVTDTISHARSAVADVVDYLKSISE